MPEKIPKTIVVTGASSGFGAMTVRTLADAGHIVYAGMRATYGAIVRVVDTPKGERPFRVHIDPADDGAEEVNGVGDAVRSRFYERIGLSDLLGPATTA